MAAFTATATPEVIRDIITFTDERARGYYWVQQRNLFFSDPRENKRDFVLNYIDGHRIRQVHWRCKQEKTITLYYTPKEGMQQADIMVA